MRVAETELAHLHNTGLHITEKCDGCGKILNQSFRYTVARQSGVFCSALCRDRASLGDDGLARAAKRRTCLLCHGPKPASDAPYCQHCQKAADPEGVDPQETRCAVCGGKLSEFRKNRAGTCSTVCSEALRKRRQRESRLGEESSDRKPPLQDTHFATLKAGHFGTSRPLAYHP
jgi:predicted nucleic acid-binding Zn ribbon protein